MSFGIPVRNGVGLGLRLSTALSSGARGIRPTMFLNFISSNTLDSRVTFTRASTATFTGSNGLIQSSAINEARFDYNPVTLQPRGLLLEEQRTNLFLNSLINGTSLSTQSVTVTAVAHTISFYGTGTITLTGAATATVTGTGVYPNRRTLTFTPIVGVLICTVTGSVQYAQLEVGAFATSFIPTVASAVTRSADVATMTGTNFSSWYNPTEGTLVTQSSNFSTVNFPTVVGINDGTLSNRISVFSSTTVGNRLVSSSGGVTQAEFAFSNYVSGTIASEAFAIKANDFAASVNGAAVQTDTSGTVPTVTQMQLGFHAGGFSPLNGHIRSISYFNTRLPNATLQVLTV